MLFSRAIARAAHESEHRHTVILRTLKPSNSPDFVNVARRIPDLLRPIVKLRPLKLAESVGSLTTRRWNSVAKVFALLAATISLAVRKKTWSPAVFAVLTRQILFTGVDAIFVAFRFGAAFGILVIVQAALWVDMFGLSTDVVAPLLWKAIIRELAPLLACMVVVGRSGIAISTELATMVVGEELDVLDSQGIDPMTFLIVPRIVSFVFSVFALGLIIAVAMILTGYVVGYFMDVIRLSWLEFVRDISSNFNWIDALFFCTKTIIASSIAGTICCLRGIEVKPSITDVPRVASLSGIHALTAIFAVSAILSLFIYGQISVFKFFESGLLH